MVRLTCNVSAAILFTWPEHDRGGGCALSCGLGGKATSARLIYCAPESLRAAACEMAAVEMVAVAAPAASAPGAATEASSPAATTADMHPKLPLIEVRYTNLNYTVKVPNTQVRCPNGSAKCRASMRHAAVPSRSPLPIQLVALSAVCCQ